MMMDTCHHTCVQTHRRYVAKMKPNGNWRLQSIIVYQYGLIFATAVTPLCRMLEGRGGRADTWELSVLSSLCFHKCKTTQKNTIKSIEKKKRNKTATFGSAGMARLTFTLRVTWDPPPPPNFGPESSRPRRPLRPGQTGRLVPL